MSIETDINLNNLLNKIGNTPEKVTFNEVMQIISEQYLYQPTSFTNGGQLNDAFTNEASCKIFSFAKIHNLTESQTLSCFGDYYRKDVLENPTGTDHTNIRNFIKTGWSGIEFKALALS